MIYDPVRQELFTASRGEGARLNQYRVRVSPCLQLSQALLGTGFPEDLTQHIKSFVAVAHQAVGVRHSGSAALDLAYVAAARLDGFWEYDLGAWDIAAGALLVSEAGGLLAEPNGELNYLKSGNIVAANPKLLEQLLVAIK